MSAATKFVLEHHPKAELDISVVFATCDRAGQLAQTLDAYRRLDTYGLTWELIVVDNGSEDNTAELLAHAAQDLPLRYLFVAERGQNRARNAALNLLQGHLIVFTDDDVLPAPGCLQAYHSAAQRWPTDMIFGARIDPRFPASTPYWLTDPSFEFSTTAFARYAPADCEGHVERHPYGPSFAVRRTALDGHCFAEHLGPQQGAYAMGGEGEFLRRIAAKGHKYVYVPDARVEHVVREEQVCREWLIRRARNKGRGQVYLPSRKKRRHIYIDGAPLRLWLATARSAIRFYAISPFVGERKRLLIGIKYALRLGQLEEMREHGGRLPIRFNRGGPN